MAESTTSSLMPCSRKRTNMRSRVRRDVMPMPDWVGGLARATISSFLRYSFLHYQYRGQASL